MIEELNLEDLLASVQTESGASLLAVTQASPVLLIFLRHFGCSFCRQTISQIAELRQELEARGVRPVFVHLGTPEIAKAHFDYYSLGHVERIHDPQAALYQHPVFGLRRTSAYSHVFKPKVIAGWLKGAIFRHGIGKIQGDGEQMPGVFFLHGPVIVRSFVHRTIADQPDYLALVT
jgi:thiol-disulfide isomerase/thioredoxin